MYQSKLCRPYTTVCSHPDSDIADFTFFNVDFFAWHFLLSANLQEQQIPAEKHWNGHSTSTAADTVSHGRQDFIISLSGSYRLPLLLWNHASFSHFQIFEIKASSSLPFDHKPQTKGQRVFTSLHGSDSFMHKIQIQDSTTYSDPS